MRKKLMGARPRVSIPQDSSYCTVFGLELVRHLENCVPRLSMEVEGRIMEERMRMDSVPLGEGLKQSASA
jgi:hypothetical protein